MEQLLNFQTILYAVMVIFFTIVSWLLLKIVLVEYRTQYKQAKQKKLKLKDSELLNSFMFDIITFKEACNIIQKYYTENFQKRVLIDGIIELHESFHGELAEKLSTLYTGSGLYLVQYNDISSPDWYYRANAVRVFSTLRYEPALELIKEKLYDQNPEVKHNALLAIINIMGWDSVNILSFYPYKIPNWTLIHMEFEFVQLDDIKAEKIFTLMENSNESIQILGLRLISRFRLNDIYESVIISFNQPSEQINSELRFIEQRLGYKPEL